MEMMEMALGPSKWKFLLSKFYNFRIIIPKDYSKMLNRLKYFDLYRRDFHNAMNFLEEHGLIKIRRDNFYYLTSEGFKVAFELEKQNREMYENRRFRLMQWLMIIFSGILAISSIFNFLI